MNKVEHIFKTIEETSICPICNHEFVTAIHGPPKDCKDTFTVMDFRDSIRVYYYNKDRKSHVSCRCDESISFNIPYRKLIGKKTNLTYLQWKNRWCK